MRISIEPNQFQLLAAIEQRLERADRQTQRTNPNRSNFAPSLAAFRG